MFSFSTPDVTAAAKIVAEATDRQTAAIDRLNSTLNQTLQELGTVMSAELEAVKNEVTQLKDVNKGVVTLLTSLHDQLVAAKDDPAAVLAIANDIKAERETLANAVTANTPAG